MRILLILLLLSAQQAYAQADFNVFEASIADLQKRCPKVSDFCAAGESVY